MDLIGQFIANLHQILGHMATARFLGEPVGDMAQCVLCRFERGSASKQDVINAIGMS